MALSDWIEKLGRTIFEAPFTGTQISQDAPELAEIRLAVLDEVKSKSHLVSGRHVFPYNIVRINFGGIPEDQSRVLKSAFFSRFFEEELKGGLSRARYRFPEDLQVEIKTTSQLPGPREQWLWIETETREGPPLPAAHPRKPAKLTVLKGVANQTEIVLNKTRTNIGRTFDVYRANGPSRRNDIAFTEDTEINRTVSREHAHILFDQSTGEYRLFNDRFYKAGNKTEGGCGLWIIRSGLSNEVHRNSRGTRLQSGDEIHLGLAAMKFRGTD